LLAFGERREGDPYGLDSVRAEAFGYLPSPNFEDLGKGSPAFNLGLDHVRCKEGVEHLSEILSGRSEE
jgi:hypothetical protein